MHGVVHIELERFARDSLGPETWARASRRAGLEGRAWQADQRYEDEELERLVMAAAFESGLGPQRLLERFGEALVPTLVAAYGDLIDPSWRTIELIVNTEEIIHTSLRQTDPNARPPMLKAVRRGADEVAVIYASERRMCGLAKGISRGIAAHYGERIEIADDACMLRGDQTCDLGIRRIG